MAGPFMLDTADFSCPIQVDAVMVSQSAAGVCHGQALISLLAIALRVRQVGTHPTPLEDEFACCCALGRLPPQPRC